MRIDVTICIEDEPGGSNIQITATDEFAMDVDGLRDMATSVVDKVLAASGVEA